MKGISAVIGALIVLIITIVLGGLAYTFIVGSATRQVAIAIELDPGLTRCVISGGAYVINVAIKNVGTDPIPWSSISVSGTSSIGVALTNVGPCTNAGNLAAGQSAACTRPAPGGLTGGTTGTNKVAATVGTSTASGVTTCVGL